MAIIWADSFDHYGTTPSGGRTNMAAAGWVFTFNAVGSSIDVSAAQARTGTYSLRIAHGANALSQARRIIGAEKTVIGQALGLFLNALPVANNEHGLEIRNAANENIVRLAIEADGSIGVYTGTGHVLVGSSDPVLSATTWNHLEYKVVVDDVVGSVELKVLGITVLELTDLDLGVDAASQFVYGSLELGAEHLTYYFDDLVPWDDTGANNNDFIGQQRVHTGFAVVDTAEADWVPVGDAEGFDCINDVPPDGDTTYLSASTVSDISEFGLDDLPPETNAIVGVYVPTMGKLEEAGLGNVQTSLVSGGVASSGPSQPFTTAYAYYGVVHELDPNTGEPWTKSAVEAALLRLEKTV